MTPIYEATVRECCKTKTAHEGIPSKTEGPRGDCPISQRRYVYFPRQSRHKRVILRHLPKLRLGQFTKAIAYLDSEIAECMRGDHEP